MASTASIRKGAKIQLDILWFYQTILISEFKNQGKSEVLSSDFSGLRNPRSLIDFTSPTTYTAIFPQITLQCWCFHPRWSPLYLSQTYDRKLGRHATRQCSGGGFKFSIRVLFYWSHEPPFMPSGVLIHPFVKVTTKTNKQRELCQALLYQSTYNRKLDRLAKTPFPLEFYFTEAANHPWCHRIFFTLWWMSETFL